MERTPTEIAFEKAQAFDMILGYINEKSLEQCKAEEPCDNILEARYNLELYGPTSIIMGILQRYFENKKPQEKIK